MDQAPVALPTVREVMQSFRENKRLIHLVRQMAQEMEKLQEDNRQLRAAVVMYREVARRRGSIVIEMPRNSVICESTTAPRRSSGQNRPSQDAED